MPPLLARIAAFLLLPCFLTGSAYVASPVYTPSSGIHASFASGALAFSGSARFLGTKAFNTNAVQKSSVTRLIYVASWTRVIEEEVLDLLLGLFPDLREIVAIDPLYSVRDSQLTWNPNGHTFTEVQLGKVQPLPEVQAGIQLKIKQSIFEQTRHYKDHLFHYLFVPARHQDIRSLTPRNDGKTVIALRSPGWQGQLPHDPRFYESMLSLLMEGDELLIEGCEPPLTLLPPQKIGLEDILLSIRSRLNPLPETVYVTEPIIYKKIRTVSREIVHQMHALDRTLYRSFDWFGRGSEASSRDVWNDPRLNQLLPSEKEYLLNRLETLGHQILRTVEENLTKDRHDFEQVIGVPSTSPLLEAA